MLPLVYFAIVTIVCLTLYTEGLRKFSARELPWELFSAFKLVMTTLWAAACLFGVMAFN